MPTITIQKQQFYRLLKQQIDFKKLSDLLFDFGLEVEPSDNDAEFRVEIPANRYDLLCAEGLATACRTYMQQHVMRMIEHTVAKSKVFVQPGTPRSAVACAIIKNIDLTGCYDSFIAYQETLHQTIGRDRRSISIGAHDADKIAFPVFYKKAGKLEFVPLGSDRTVRCFEELKGHFRANRKFLRYFEWMGTNEGELTVFEDRQGNVLSVPPIINSDYSKVTAESRNLFIEITGVDVVRARQAMECILYAFRGKSVEYQVIEESEDLKEENKEGDDREEDKESVNSDGLIKEYQNEVGPYSLRMTLTVDEINKSLDLNLTPTDAKTLLERMMHQVELDGQQLVVTVLGPRCDILHKCDLLEDVAVAYGFSNFVPQSPQIPSIGREDPINKFSLRIQETLAMAGLVEVVTFILLPQREAAPFGPCTELENPRSTECSCVRQQLLPSLLRAVRHNSHAKLPIRLFEVGDVVVDLSNRRHAAAVYASKAGGYEEMQGIVVHLLAVCGLDCGFRESERAGFVKLRCGDVIVGDEVVGWVGVVDLDVCAMMGIPFVCSAFELDLEKIFELFRNK